MIVANREDAPFGIFATFERVHFAARGRDGGGEGAKGKLTLDKGTVMRNKGFQPIPKGEKLIVEMPGGGGYGDPRLRAPKDVAADVLSGFIDREVAEKVYGVALTDALDVDGARTKGLRS